MPSSLFDSSNKVNEKIYELQKMNNPQQVIAYLQQKSPQEQQEIFYELCKMRGIDPQMFLGKMK